MPLSQRAIRRPVYNLRNFSLQVPLPLVFHVPNGIPQRPLCRIPLQHDSPVDHLRLAYACFEEIIPEALARVTADPLPDRYRDVVAEGEMVRHLRGECRNGKTASGLKARSLSYLRGAVPGPRSGQTSYPHPGGFGWRLTGPTISGTKIDRDEISDRHLPTLSRIFE